MRLKERKKRQREGGRGTFEDQDSSKICGERERMGERGGQVSERSDVGGKGDFYTHSFLRPGERGF